MKILLVLAFAGASASFSQVPCYLTDDPNLTINQSAAVQSCINSVPDYSTILITTTALRPPHVRVNSTLRVNGRYSLAIECQGGHVRSAGAPGFYWGGSAGGTILNTSGSTVRIAHCNFFTSVGGSSPQADVGIDVDISSTVGSVSTTTEHQYSDIGIVSMAANPNFIGIRFSQSGDMNVEAMVVDQGTLITCQGQHGIGIRVGGVTFDAFRHHYRDVSVSYCATAMWVAQGLPNIDNAHFQSNTVDVDARLGPVRLHDSDSENAGQFYVGGGGDNTTMIESNRIAACHPPPGKGCIDANGILLSRGNNFDYLGTSIPMSSQGSGYLMSDGDRYPNWTAFLQGANTFYKWEARGNPQNFTVIYGGFAGGSSVVFRCDSPGTLSYLDLTVAVLCFNPYTQKMQISDHGNSFVNLIP